jgi:hypothetical protein
VNDGAKFVFKLDNFAILMAQSDTKPAGEAKSDEWLDYLICCNEKTQDGGINKKIFTVPCPSGATREQLRLAMIIRFAALSAYYKGVQYGEMDIAVYLPGPRGAFDTFVAWSQGQDVPEQKEPPKIWRDKEALLLCTNQLKEDGTRLPVVTVVEPATPIIDVAAGSTVVSVINTFSVDVTNPRQKFVTAIPGPAETLTAIANWIKTSNDRVPINATQDQTVIIVQQQPGGDQSSCRVM